MAIAENLRAKQQKQREIACSGVRRIFVYSRRIACLGGQFGLRRGAECPEHPGQSGAGRLPDVHQS